MPVTKSPLRYPGGKTQLYSFVKNLLKINKIENRIYCEPFSGGAGVAMELLLNNEVDKVILNDIDIGIYSIWKAIIDETEEFLELIECTDITIDNWRQQKKMYEENIDKNEYSIELGFAAFFLNRTNRSGIINGGPIGGQKQLSKYKIDCRFNKNNLKEKIIDISREKERIELYQKDCKNLISEVLVNLPKNQLFTFFDPPYFKQGKNLYYNAFKYKDHVDLRERIKLMNQYYWITTYDFQPEIEEIYKDFNSLIYKIRYSANRYRKEKEILFYNKGTKVQSFDKVQFIKY